MSQAASSPTDPSVQAVVRADALRTAVATARSLVSECRVRLDSDGLLVAATDPATVASVRVTLDAAGFEHYDASDTTVGIDLDRLADVLALGDPDDLVSLTIEDSRGLLHVEHADLHYTLGLIDPDAIRAPPDPAKLDFDHAGRLTLDAAFLSRVVDASEMVSDHVTLELGAEGLRAVADGDTDTAVVEHDADPETTGEATAIYSLSYLADIVAVLPSTSVAVALGDDLPVELDYDFRDDHGHAEFVLSPRLRRT
ncbi:beta clamp domain-containing protein [Salarchaeum japonicum]|uniref:DNA polymerase sliding clamp n=1 Tax=Salarchaeum japonicum TaxID=555573 RepID=A0AAV3T059_9EURY|nr:hypothetical protein [Salarchaeum japonicum]